MKIFVGISGASGSIYGGRLLKALEAGGHDLAVCFSDAAVSVIRSEELAGQDIPAGREAAIAAFLKHHNISLDASRVLPPDDFGSAYASGSFLADAAFICPCSVSTAACIAAGITRNLIHRVADVMLKESRPLVLVLRETPLSEIHLSNLLRLAQAGAKVVPAMPAFYHRPQRIDDLADFVAGKALDVAGIEHQLFRRWEGI